MEALNIHNVLHALKLGNKIVCVNLYSYSNDYKKKMLLFHIKANLMENESDYFPIEY